MIKLTRLNGYPFTVNAVHIEQVYSFPDTTITLLNGRSMVVLEPEDEVAVKIEEFYQKSGLIGFKKRKGAYDCLKIN